jgi:hypothetical protein
MVTKLIAVFALSSGILGMALAKGKDQMRRMDDILRLNRSTF